MLPEQQNTVPEAEIKQNYYHITSYIPFDQIRYRFKTLSSQMQINDSVLVKTDQERKSLITALKLNGGDGRSKKSNLGYRVWRVK
jgi:hypothetical protein